MLRTLLFTILIFSVNAGGIRPPKESQKLIDAYNAFALKSYKQLKLEDNNIYSPYSLAVVLQMASEGAAGETLTEFQKLLGLNENSTKEVKALLAYLKTRERAGIISGQALALQKDYPIHKDYVQTIEQNYFSKVFSLDLRGEQEESTKTLNEWISKQTRGYIKQAIPDNFLSKNSTSVMINTCYFRGIWYSKFLIRNTKDRSFILTNGKHKKVKFMYSSEIYSGKSKTKEDKDYRFLSLRFRNRALMNCYLPSKISSLDKFENKLKLEDFSFGKLNWEDNRVYFPRFKFQRTHNLAPKLQKIGLKTPFNLETANFSRKTDEEIRLNRVMQKSGIIVNENGATAYSSSFGEFDDFGDAPEPQLFIFNRPFFFTIVDEPTGLILFMGRITDPSQM